MHALGAGWVFWEFGVMFRKVAMGFVGVAAFAASVVLLRSNKTEHEEIRTVPPGESVPGEIQLEKLRELGI